MRFIHSILFSLFSISTLTLADDLKIVESIQPDVTVISRIGVGDIYIIRSEWREAGPFYPYGSEKDAFGKFLKDPSRELKFWGHSGWYERPLLTGNLSGEITRVIVMSSDDSSIDHGIYNMIQRDGGEKKFGRAFDARSDAVKTILPYNSTNSNMYRKGYPLLDTESMNGSTTLSTYSIKKTAEIKDGSVHYLTTDLSDSKEKTFVGRIFDTSKDNLFSISYETFRNRMKDEQGFRLAFITGAMGLTEHQDQEKTLSFENGITELGKPRDSNCTGIKCDVFGFPIAPKPIEAAAVTGSNAPANPAAQAETAVAPKEGTVPTNAADLLKPEEPKN